MLLTYILLAIFGLMVGSFLGMLTYRLPRGLGIMGRSFCDNCHKKISWHNNIPLFSYIVLKGKCYNCKKQISVRYPLIEIITGLSFAAIGISALTLKFNGLFLYGANHALGVFSLPLLLLIGATLVALLVIDFETQILPDILVYIVGALTVVYLLALPSPALVVHIFWGFIVSLVFLAIYLLTRGRGMGFGDVKLAFVIGMLLGYPQTIVWFLLSFILGAFVGVLLLVTRRAKIGQPIPFGPFLIISAFIAAAWGDTIFVWYLTMLT